MKATCIFTGALATLVALTVPVYRPEARAAAATFSSARASASSTFGAASAPCTKATADALVNQYQLNNFDIPKPALQVLCGPFTGAASKAMVVVIGAATCWAAQGWVLFRSAAGAWKLAFRSNDWIMQPLVATGSDIKETVPVFRPTDPRCDPTGGTQARTWHWNGDTLVTGPWHRVSPGTPPPTLAPPVIVKPAAPCTDKVITAAVKSFITMSFRMESVRCVGRFAVAGVALADADDDTVFLIAAKGTWHVAASRVYCENGSLPQAISQLVCETD